MFSHLKRKTAYMTVLVMLMTVVGLSTTSENAQAAGTQSYSNLPLGCNVVVPYASTYDQTTVNGTTYYHGHALDFPAPSGTPVAAPSSGTAYTRYDGGYGNYVDVVADNGITHRMAHLQGSGLIGSGSRVSKGQIVGGVGSTGASTGPHLHYEQLSGGTKIQIQLAGPPLQWGARYTADGDRTTTHAVKSTNCGSTPASGPKNDPNLIFDVAGYSNGQMRLSLSHNGGSTGFRVATGSIDKPFKSYACNFDGDRESEYISYEKHRQRFIMGDPRSNATFAWTTILSGVGNISDFTCIDWNRDGWQDIFARDGRNGAIYVGYSNGQKVSSWQRIKTPSGSWVGMVDPEFLVKCDLNGDGAQEVVAYVANRRFMYAYPTGSERRLVWGQLKGGFIDADAVACANFNPDHKGDEIITWQQGTYFIGEFGASLRLQNWDALSPGGFGHPHKGEIVGGDIDGDGRAELLVNERRGGHNYVMAMDFTSSRNFRWYTYLNKTTVSFIQTGRFH